MRYQYREMATAGREGRSGYRGRGGRHGQRTGRGGALLNGFDRLHLVILGLLAQKEQSQEDLESSLRAALPAMAGISTPIISGCLQNLLQQGLINRMDEAQVQSKFSASPAGQDWVVNNQHKLARYQQMYGTTSLPTALTGIGSIRKAMDKLKMALWTKRQQVTLSESQAQEIAAAIEKVAEEIGK
ncbi:hypothetical protein [Cedecea colo]|uniref:Uncharacterized protein n=1 Tax=Cedecea colo TaxID=2552946 RepID=A0ABX0VPX6_9ENTR|nr:hypothetical protein [Cedecea colo]NIY48704.1 hypothetical protein [Cedecea colo]